MGYSIERGGWSDTETLALVRMIEVDGRSHSQVARCLGRSRNACIGKYFRLFAKERELARIRSHLGIKIVAIESDDESPAPIVSEHPKNPTAYEAKDEWMCREQGCTATRMRPYGLCWQHKHNEIMRKKED